MRCPRCGQTMISTQICHKDFEKCPDCTYIHKPTDKVKAGKM